MSTTGQLLREKVFYELKDEDQGLEAFKIVEKHNN